MKELMEQSESAPYKFKAESEALFGDFRLSCIHLRNERAALDSVTDKDVAWRFICRFSREVPFQNNRCVEVLKILLLSDIWMKAFLQDPEVDVAELPKEIAEEFGKRLDEVQQQEPAGPGPKGKTDPRAKDPKEDPRAQAAQAAKDPKAKDDGYPTKYPSSQDPFKQATPPSVTVGGMPPLVAKSMTVVVQRCISAKLSSDDQSKQTAAIGPGIIVSVSMADGATEEGVTSAARFVLTSKLSGRTGWFPGANGMDKYGGGAESVVSLCKRGEHQGIMVIPQLSLVSDITEGMDLEYTRSTKQHQRTAQMYALFVRSLQDAAPELVEQVAQCSTSGCSRQSWNGQPGQSCCRSCSKSNGSSHGAGCESKEKTSAPGVRGFFRGIGDAIRGPTATAVEIVAGDFDGTQFLEVKSAGPFMHSFAF